MVRKSGFRSLCAAALGMAMPPLTAHAELWPGHDAPPGGAIAAQAIGESCDGFLSVSEVSELADYVAERAEAFSKGSEAERGYPAFFPRLASGYRETYSQADNCTPSAREMARDMLERVRRVRGGEAPGPQK